LHELEVTRHPDLLVGLDQPDDAGVYRLASGIALVQTVDFFTPIVDDPFDWGRIAAANALSDVYAMGGTPLTALSIVGWPREELSLDLLAEVQRGGATVLNEAECTLIGGHSIDDREPKYGLAITGTVDAASMMTNNAARVGDRLVLTKPLGTGIISTAIKRDRATPEQVEAAVEVMTTLNLSAAEAALASGVRAATDVTGFGLLGHLGEIVQASSVGARIDHRWIPLLPGVEALAADGVVPGGTNRNLATAIETTRFEGVSEVMQYVLADAQTSGGLLLAVGADRCERLVAALGEAGTPAAAVIGEFVEGAGITVV
jgi:selenide,water dikinase